MRPNKFAEMLYLTRYNHYGLTELSEALATELLGGDSVEWGEEGLVCCVNQTDY